MINEELHNQLAQLVKDADIHRILLELVNICSDNSFKCSEQNMNQSAENWKAYQHTIHDASLRIENKIAFLPDGKLQWP